MAATGAGGGAGARAGAGGGLCVCAGCGDGSLGELGKLMWPHRAQGWTEISLMRLTSCHMAPTHGHHVLNCCAHYVHAYVRDTLKENRRKITHIGIRLGIIYTLKEISRNQFYYLNFATCNVFVNS